MPGGVGESSNEILGSVQVKQVLTGLDSCGAQLIEQLKLFITTAAIKMATNFVQSPDAFPACE